MKVAVRESFDQSVHKVHIPAFSAIWFQSVTVLECTSTTQNNIIGHEMEAHLEGLHYLAVAARLHH